MSRDRDTRANVTLAIAVVMTGLLMAVAFAALAFEWPVVWLLPFAALTLLSVLGAAWQLACAGNPFEPPAAD